VDDIRMNFDEIGCGGMDWIGLDKWWVLLKPVMKL
jgi:hypothetical protein